MYKELFEKIISLRLRSEGILGNKDTYFMQSKGVILFRRIEASMVPNFLNLNIVYLRIQKHETFRIFNYDHNYFGTLVLIIYYHSHVFFTSGPSPLIWIYT